MCRRKNKLLKTSNSKTKRNTMMTDFLKATERRADRLAAETSCQGKRDALERLLVCAREGASPAAVEHALNCLERMGSAHLAVLKFLHNPEAHFGFLLPVKWA